MKKIEGLIAAPFSPMKSNGDINYSQIGPYADLLHRNGVAGGFVCGSTGECASLSVEERLHIVEGWIKESPKDFKVIVCAGSNALPDVKRILVHAQKNGAHAAALMTPYYFKPGSISALVEFCADAAQAAPELPVYYYHIPVMTGSPFAMRDFLERASERIPNLAGIKFTHENLMDYSECVELMDGKYDVLFGRDEMLLSALPLGARGAIGSTFNFAAPLYLRLIDSFKKGDMDSARKAQIQSHKLLRALFSLGVAPGAVFKAVMAEIGLDCGDARLPLPRLDAETKAHLVKGLTDCSFHEFRCR